MTRADFINRFKNHFNIGARSYVAYIDAVFFVYEHPYCKQHVNREMFYFLCVVLEH